MKQAEEYRYKREDTFNNKNIIKTTPYQIFSHLLLQLLQQKIKTNKKQFVKNKGTMSNELLKITNKSVKRFLKPSTQYKPSTQEL